MLLHCCAPEQRQASGIRNQESGLLLLASGEPVEPDSEEARQGQARLGLRGFPTLKLTSESYDSLVLPVHVLCPRVPALTRSTPRLFPLLEDMPPSHGVQDRTGSVPNPKDFPIPNRTRIHFLIILPDVPPSFHALHRETALPTDWDAKGLHRIRLVSHCQSLTTVSRAGFLVERRLLLLLLLAA
jgi:hypothetical protein